MRNRQQLVRPATRALGALVAVSCVATSAACSSKSDKSPIKIGAIAQLSGTQGIFAESTQAAKAVFDQVNASGGIGGRKIDYKVTDDTGDAGKSAQAVRQLIDQDGVVALAGSASAVDCLNAPYYVAKKVLSVVGVGILPQCFSSPNMSPVNTGPYFGVAVSLEYAVQTLHKKAVCVITHKANGFQEASQAAIAQFEKATGQKVVSSQFADPTDGNFLPEILRAKQAGCDTIVSVNPGPTSIAYEKQFNSAGIRSSITSIELASAYSEDISKALADIADGIYANSEFLPFTGSGASDPALAPYLDLMKTNKIAPNSFGEGGYVAAQVMVNALKSVKGKIDRASVTKALQTMAPYATPLLGTPYTFGTAATHQPNTSSRFVQLKSGVWQPVTTTWTTLRVG